MPYFAMLRDYKINTTDLEAVTPSRKIVIVSDESFCWKTYKMFLLIRRKKHKFPFKRKPNFPNNKLVE